MKTKINSDYRLAIPKALVDILDLQNGECYLYFDKNQKCLYITKDKRYTGIEIINKRLKNKDITASERHFLERLRDEL